MNDVKPVRQAVHVNTESKAYDVLFGHGILDKAGELSAGVVKTAAAAIVTDSTVGGLYAERLETSLRAAGIRTVRFTFPAGEVSKNTENYVNLLEFMAENGLTRSDAVFALGGGVAGDLAGFAAATYMRGVKFVQIPTSLLAMVDSSVGGKTGIDLRAGKNLAGAFYQPELVICDISMLDTLPEEQLLSGWGEIIKYGMICDGSLLEMLKVRNPAELEDIIVRCVGIKRDIVGSDEKESGVRKLLNFGHTVGHAIEKCTGYAVSHGKAVGIGMAVITRATVQKGLCPNSCYEELTQLLRLYGLPDRTDLDGEELFNAMLSDKKRGAEGITLIVPESAGHCILKTVSLDEARELLKLGL